MNKSTLNVKMPIVDYDPSADVMYISFGEPLPSGTIEPEETSGILVRYTDLKNKKDTLSGITILNYHKRTKNAKRSQP